MIAVVLLSLLQFSAAAVPMMRHQDPMIFGLDDMPGFLYEVPDYEDPQMLEYEISAMGASPMLSLLHFAKQPNNKNRNVPDKEVAANIKAELDEIINRLQTMQTSLEKGSGTIHYQDIEKSIQGLKKLEHTFRPNIQQLLSSMRQTVSLAKPIYKTDLLKFISTMQPGAIGVPATKHPVYAVKPHATETPERQTEAPVREMEPQASEAPIYEIKLLPTKAPVYKKKPYATEEPVVALQPPSTVAPLDSSHEEEEKTPPFKEEVFKSESIKEVYERNPYQSRWTWRTAGLL